MFKKLNDVLSGVPATLIGGLFLLCSFFFPKLGIELPIDPAWVTVLISGIPLLYLSVWRSIHDKGISKNCKPYNGCRVKSQNIHPANFPQKSKNQTMLICKMCYNLITLL